MNFVTILVSVVNPRSMRCLSVPDGIQGAAVIFDFQDPLWDGLTKIAVSAGNVTRAVVLDGNEAMIPHATVLKEGVTLMVGIYGVDEKSNLVIPSLCTTVGSIQEAVSSSEDPRTDSELPIWARLASSGELDGDDYYTISATGSALVYGHMKNVIWGSAEQYITLR